MIKENYIIYSICVSKEIMYKRADFVYSVDSVYHVVNDIVMSSVAEF